MYDLNVLLLDEWTDLGETLDKHCLAHCESHICKYVRVCSLLVLLMYADIRLEDLQVHTNLMAPLNIISKHCLILLAVHANFFRLITAIPSVPSNASALCEVNFKKMSVRKFEKHTEIPEIVAIQTVTVQLSREFKLHN